jgi:hypothetical protein
MLIPKLKWISLYQGKAGYAYVALPPLHFIHSQSLPLEEKKTMSLYEEGKSSKIEMLFFFLILNSSL